MLALEISDLYKTYSSGLQALKGISLEVEQGDFFALLGPNGAGKSTCIGIISGLVNKTGGTINIFGHSIDNEFILAKSLLGSVPQEFNFNTFEPVEEIIVNQAGFYGVTARRARVETEHYLKQLGLWQHRRSQARRLSGGMKRRLMIARALIHKPRLLILDEPTAGVDIELRRSMWDFLEQINEQGTTIILTTHYLEEAERMCRNIAIIDEGKIIAQGTPDGLKGGVSGAQVMVVEAENLTDDAIAALRQTYPEVRAIEGGVEIEAEEVSVDGIADCLRPQGVAIQSAHRRQVTLDDVFLQLTGKQLRE